MDTTYFSSIQEYPSQYTEHTVMQRMLDGLGFRYYWATHELTPKDLEFKPGEGSRSSEETLRHIYDLSRMLHLTIHGEEVTSDTLQYDFDTLRRLTMNNIEKSRKRLDSQKALDSLQIIFRRGEQTRAYPFWNLINGPIADAIWHVGQIVSYRRLSGNPINPKVSMFSGKVRD